MTILKTNTGIGLQPNGTVLTTGNSGAVGKDAFSYINGSPTQLATGIDLGGGSPAKAVGWTGLTADLTVAGRLCFTLTAAPSATTQVIQARPASGIAFAITIRADRKFTITDATGATIGSASTTVLALNTDYRFEWVATIATSTTGQLELRLYAEGSTTVVETLTSSTANLGTTGVTAYRFGHDNTTGTIGLTGRHLAIADAAALIGEYSAPSTPPTVAVTVGDRYMVDARTTAPGSGGTLTYTISQNTGPTTAAEEPFDGLFLIPQGVADTVWTITATESPSGLTDTETVTVPAATVAVDPDGYSEELVYDGSAWV